MTSRSHELPVELYECIFEHLKDDERSLRTCSVVCHRLLLISRRHLFVFVRLNFKTLGLFSRLLDSNHFPISCFVRRLSMDWISRTDYTSPFYTLKSLTVLTITYAKTSSLVEVAEWISSLPQLQKLGLWQSFDLGMTSSLPFNRLMLLTSNLQSFYCEANRPLSDFLSWLSPQVAFRSLQQLRLRISTTDSKAVYNGLLATSPVSCPSRAKD
jgi:hypothetical protein